MDSDPRVYATLFGVVPPTTKEETTKQINMIHAQYEKNGIGRWAVVEKASGLYIGWAGIKIEHDVNVHDTFFDLGYRFIPEFWGMGYATETSKALVAYGFKVLNKVQQVDKICAYVESENIGSRKVAEKAGLKLVSTFVGDRMDEWWLEIRPDEFDEGSAMEGVEFVVGLN